jgi:LasA protease
MSRFLKRIGLSLIVWLSACQPAASSAPDQSAAEHLVPEIAAEMAPAPTPFPTRPVYSPGEWVDYIAQTGDTLPALAVHFNTTIAEIREANPFIPEKTTTMPPGMPMKIPIYYAPFWGSPYAIIPDSTFINGPGQVNFSTSAFIAQHPGWLSRYKAYASGDNRTAAQIIDLVALNFSVSPRILLALVEFHAGGLSQPVVSEETEAYPLGLRQARNRGLYLQLIWAANTLNNGYYGWRTGRLETFDLLDGRVDRPDPWQNAASVGLHYYFSLLLDRDAYLFAIGPQGFAEVYRELFGDPWQAEAPHLPGSLEQPPLLLPFESGKKWALTGGPHTAWGQGEPYTALDFGPGLLKGGCTPTDEWAIAVADGVVARSELATVVLDLDGDGDERTGWVVFYFHLATEGRVPAGASLKAGDPVGYPSCEGGRATGTHVHIARKYNGEWIPAGGPLAFNLEGWVAAYGAAPYLGTMTRSTRTVIACTCSDENSQIQAGERNP